MENRLKELDNEIMDVTVELGYELNKDNWDWDLIHKLEGKIESLDEKKSKILDEIYADIDWYNEYECVFNDYSDITDNRHIYDTLMHIEEIWMNYPEWRLGQLLYNLARDADRDIFNIEDSEWIKIFKNNLT